MTTTAGVPARPTTTTTHRPEPLAASRALLWLPVASAAAMAWLLSEAFLAVADGAPDLDPLYGLMLLLYWGAAILMGLVSLVLALVLSFSPSSGRASGVLASAVLTALGGFAAVAMSAYSNATDPMLTVSSTAGHHLPWEAAALVVVLLPLGAALLARHADRGPGRRP